MKTFETPISEIESIYAYFHDPAHSAEIQVASARTKYVWQHMSNYYPTEQLLQDEALGAWVGRNITESFGEV